MIKVINIVTGTIIAQYERHVVRSFEESYSHITRYPGETDEKWAARLKPARERHEKQDQDAANHNEAVLTASALLASRLNGHLEEGSTRRDSVKMYLVVDTSNYDCLGIVNVELNQN